MIVEAQDPRAGKGHQDRRMRGDDELGLLIDHLLQHRHQGQLSLRRERGFGFIEQIESAGHKARLEELQKALAVRIGVEVLAVPLDQRPSLPEGRAFRQPQGVPGVFFVETVGDLLQLSCHSLQPPREVEEVLGAQKKPAMSLVQPRELQMSPQGARILQRLVALDVVAADRGQFDARADRFEQRRFARTVLAYEESHRRMELELIEFFDQRQIERKARSLLRRGLDRKSTRLNSSHVKISYAVFCLKKKKKRQAQRGLRKKGETEAGD